MTIEKPRLILCSTSTMRKTLLKQLQLPFETCSPNIDESRRANEPAKELVRRLAVEKAQVHAQKYPNSLIIASDQVIMIQGKIEGKPRDHHDAIRILKNCSGQWIDSLTSLCLLNTGTTKYQLVIEPYRVLFRTLTTKIIEEYLLREKPYQCAGSLRVEGLGIALLEELVGRDPSALHGLPLIQLIKMLEKESVSVL